MRMRTVLALLLVAVPGCSVIDGFVGAVTGKFPCDPVSPSKPAVSEQALRAAWWAHVGPLPSPACDAPWLWAVVSEEDLVRSCGPNANECTVFSDGTGGELCALSVTSTKFAQSKELNTHGFAHYALRCSRGNSDSDHTDYPDVWAQFDGSFGP